MVQKAIGSETLGVPTDMEEFVTGGKQFGAQSTAEEVAAGADLKGKLVVVTGASAGIGRITARVLANAGATVVAGARRLLALSDIEHEIEEGRGKVLAQQLDLESIQSVRDFAAAVTGLDRPVDLLINNAGIMAVPLKRSITGIESQFNTNFLGHAILTSELASSLRKSDRARVISLTSLAHQRADIDFDDMQFERKPYDPWKAYGQSKTASSLLAVKVRAALADSGVTAFAVHPGIIPDTELADHVSEEGQASLKNLRSGKTPRVIKSNSSGAATTIWAALAPELAGRDALYLEDCGIAPRIDTPNFVYGVLPYALDSEAAERLWSAAGALVGHALPL